MIPTRFILTRAALAALLFGGGCAQLRAASASPPAPMEGQLTATLQQAEQAAQQGKFGVADRLLVDFAERFPNTPEALETGYWRAVFVLDPANATAGPRDAIALLDAYLAAPVIVAHRGAAAALRRIAGSLDRPRVAAAAPAPSAGCTCADAKSETKGGDPSRDEEVQRLKSELAKANAELERIKRRLAQPNP